MATYAVGEFSTLLSIAGTALTTAYAGNQIAIPTYGAESVAIYVSYTKGSETSLQVQVEVYDDVTAAWMIVPYVDSSLTVALSKTATGTFRIPIVKLSDYESQIRVSAKSTGASNGTTAVTITGQLRGIKVPVRA